MFILRQTSVKMAVLLHKQAKVPFIMIIAVYAQNDDNGQVLRRHLSRFTKIMEKSTQPPVQVDHEDQGETRNDDIIPLSVINEAPPPQPNNLEPGIRQHEEPQHQQ